MLYFRKLPARSRVKHLENNTHFQVMGPKWKEQGAFLDPGRDQIFYKFIGSL